jgi:hypothetical protein
MSLLKISAGAEIASTTVGKLSLVSSQNDIGATAGHGFYNSASLNKEIALSITAKQARGFARSLAQTSTQLQSALNKVIILKSMTERIAELADFAQRTNVGKTTKSNLRLEAAGIQRAYQVMVSKSITVGGNPKIGSDKQSGGVAFLNNISGGGTDISKTYGRTLKGVSSKSGNLTGTVKSIGQKYKFKMTTQKRQNLHLTLNRSGKKLQVQFRNMNIAAKGWMGSQRYAKSVLTGLGTSYAQVKTLPTAGDLDKTNTAAKITQTKVSQIVLTKHNDDFNGAALWSSNFQVSNGTMYVNVSASKHVEKIYTNGSMELQRSIQLLANSLFIFEKAQEMNTENIAKVEHEIENLIGVNQAEMASSLAGLMASQSLHSQLVNVLIRSTSIEHNGVLNNLSLI